MMKYKTVEAFLADLSQDKKEQVELLRKHIILAEPTLTENIKWNAPNYVFQGVDRVTFNVRNKEQLIQLILHKGAVEKEDPKGEPVMKDDSGLIKWNSNIRGTLSFSGLQDIETHADELTGILNKWLAIE